MAEVNLRLRVITPVWLTVTMWIWVRAVALVAVVRQREVSHAQVDKAARWYADRLRIVTDITEPNPIRG